MQYVWSGMIIVVGIYLNMYSKRSKLTIDDVKKRIMNLLDPKYDKKFDDNEHLQLVEEV